MREVGPHLFENFPCGIEIIQDINRAMTVIGEAIHVGNEDPAVRALCHESHTLETLRRNGYRKSFGEIKIKGSASRERNVMRPKPELRRLGESTYDLPRD